LTTLLEQKQETKLNTESLPQFLQQVDDLEDLIDWDETQRSTIQGHSKLLKICENSFAAIRGCVEDLHNLELATEIGESNTSRHAKHALWNLACSFKGLQQAHSEPSLLSRPGRAILNSYLEKTMRLGALLLEIHGYGDWAGFWREMVDGGHVDAVNFKPAESPYETNVKDTSLYAILNPLSKTPGTSIPFGIIAGTRYADATPTIIHTRQGRIPDWNAKALKENPKVRGMYEKLNAQAAHPASIRDEGSFNIGWSGEPDTDE